MDYFLGSNPGVDNKLRQNNSKVWARLRVIDFTEWNYPDYLTCYFFFKLNLELFSSLYPTWGFVWIQFYKRK